VRKREFVGVFHFGEHPRQATGVHRTMVPVRRFNPRCRRISLMVTMTDENNGWRFSRANFEGLEVQPWSPAGPGGNQSLSAARDFGLPHGPSAGNAVGAEKHRTAPMRQLPSIGFYKRSRPRPGRKLLDHVGVMHDFVNVRRPARPYALPTQARPISTARTTVPAQKPPRPYPQQYFSIRLQSAFFCP